MTSEYPTSEPRNGRGHDRPAGERPLADLGARVAVAVPAAAVAVLVVLQGGLLLALALSALGVVAVLEVFRLVEGAAPVRAVGAVAVAVLPLAALYGGLPGAMIVFLASGPAALALLGRERPEGGAAIAATVLGVAWVGLALAHGVLLRTLPDGERLAIAVLIGTFLGDTAAHLLGSALGRTQIAPRLSPRKTLEGLVAGVVVGTASLWAFMALSDATLGGVEAVVLGLAVTAAAPVGDLFESRFKRDAGMKDTGTALGPHGGVLDRIDAVLFSAVAAYYVASLLG